MKVHRSLFSALVFFCSFLITACSPSVQPAAGSSAPDFELVDTSGETISLKEMRGRPVVINFWATWCGPCEKEMPLLESRYQQYQPDLVILAVNYAERSNRVQDFTARLGLTFSPLVDERGQVADLYRVNLYPTTFFVDGTGVIQAVKIGELGEDEIDNYLAMIGIAP
jgi:thiol-disulfide isomerase/thioredoxin